MPTAFTAAFGSGRPIFGFLGEYDALDGLSQAAASPKKMPMVPGGPGHGCGHNALGAGALGAALAVKDYLLSSRRGGTVIYYGCPAEEGAGAKQFMARAGVFDGVDFIYTWHPSDINQVQSQRSAAIMGAVFRFAGISSHAGSSPHLGRSALDAAELMSVGANYLREHMPDGARIHYAYSDAGGTAPNVVQDRAAVKYEVRASKVAQVKELFERVADVARGAALMTGTKMEYEITMAFSDYIPNSALTETADEAFREIGAPRWDKADYALARSFMDSFDAATRQASKQSLTEVYGEKQSEEIMGDPLDGEVHPFDPLAKPGSGSTDVGDVCYTVPVISFNVACAFAGNVGHTWQMTGQSGSRLAHKGLLTAAKVMALAAVKTMHRPQLIEKAKHIVARQNGGAYICPLPREVQPPLETY